PSSAQWPSPIHSEPRWRAGSSHARSASRKRAADTVASPSWTVAPQYEQTTERANRLGESGPLHTGHLRTRSAIRPRPAMPAPRNRDYASALVEGPQRAVEHLGAAGDVLPRGPLPGR